MPTLSCRVTVPLLLLVSSVLSGCASTSSNGDAALNQGNWPICTVFGLICYAQDGDDDSDGVHDRRDVCPDTPAHSTVNNSGCPLPQYPVAAPTPPPEPPPAPVAQHETIVLSDAGDVLFAFDSADLSEAAKSTLTEVSSRLTGASLVSVQVAGHTDGKGSDEYNQKLSERRAQSVSDFLTAHGVPAQKLSVVGYGESQPVADNSTDSGRAQNRRVELHVTR